MTLGEIINKYRTEHALSMDKFAQKAGISKAYVSMLEKNENPRNGNPITPSLETYINVSNAMGISLNDLLEKCDANQDVMINHKEQKLSPNARFLLDKIPNMTEKQLKQMRALSEIIDEE